MIMPGVPLKAFKVEDDQAPKLGGSLDLNGYPLTTQTVVVSPSDLAEIQVNRINDMDRAFFDPYYSQVIRCLTPLELETYDNSGQVNHPAVIFTGRPVAGYSWWQANMPCSHSNRVNEGPSIWCSDDGKSWYVPPGLTNPIIHNNAQEDNISVFLFFDGSTFYCFWLIPSTGLLVYRTCTDGVSWGPSINLGTFANCLLGSMIADRGVFRWWMWNSQLNKIVMYTTSYLNGGNLSAPTLRHCRDGFQRGAPGAPGREADRQCVCDGTLQQHIRPLLPGRKL